jgi:drug/metabolite transporter (DMT)-like permease
MRLSSQAIGWLALVTTTIAGSTYSAFAKDISRALSPWSLLFLSEFLTLLFVTASFGCIPLLQQTYRLSKEILLPLFIIAILNSALAPLLWFTGLQGTAAVNASLFGSSDVFFLIILATIILRESIGRAHIAAAGCIALGIVFVALRGFEEHVTLQWGDVLILMASFNYSVGSIVFRKYLHHIEPQIVIFFRSCVALGIFFITSLFVPHPLLHEMRSFPLNLVPALLGFAFIARFLNVFMYYIAIDRLEVTTVSIFNSLSIVLGPVFAFILIEERLHWYHFVAGGFLFIGTLLFEFIGVHPTKTHHRNYLDRRIHNAS